MLNVPIAYAERASRSLATAAPDGCVLYLAATDDSVGTLCCLPPDAGVNEFCDTVVSLLGDRCSACRLRPVCRAERGAVSLSRRQQQVAIHVAAGLPSKQIAAALGIGLRTVNTYRESLAKKLGASSPAVLTRYVLEHRLDLS